MKKGILKRILSAVATAALLVGGGSSVVSADTITYTKVEKDDSYYTTTLGLKGNPSLTIEKYQVDTSKPISGVEFRYAKVGALYQVENSTKHTVEMAYKLDDSFVTAVNKDGNANSHLPTADYTGSTGDSYYIINPNVINTALQNNSIQNHSEDAGLRDYVDKLTSTVTTDNEGKATISSAEYGLYLVVEYNTANAKVNGEKVSITNIQSPFVVALPTANEDGSWNKDVVARVKNAEGSADVEKKIVTNDNVEEPTLDDTDTTSVGDTVTFQLHGTVPVISSITNGNAEKINKYVLTDNLSKGLTPVEPKNAKDLFVKATVGNTDLVYGTHYTYEITDYAETKTGTDTTTEAEYANGKTITVTFTADGLKELDKIAQNNGGDVYFYYQAKVNADAEIGPNDSTSMKGNPNEVKLNYQIGTSSEMETSWDKVTEYTFGIDVTKKLSGEEISSNNKNNSNIQAIKFVLYKEAAGSNTYYTFTKSEDGVYTVLGTTDSFENNNAAIMNPAAEGGKLYIKGLEIGTYYLKETATVKGYNLLKAPVEITITAIKGDNAYVGGTNNQYIGTIDQTIKDADGNTQSNTDGIFKLTINNTKGFTLPTTGGAGIWFFVLAGVIIVAAGCGYYMVSSRKNHSK